MLQRSLLPIITVAGNEPNNEALASEIFAGHIDVPRIAHHEIATALELSVRFNQDESPVRGDYMRREFADFSEVVSKVPGYRGCFGTGHPYYANKPDGGIYEIPEITRYINQYRNSLRNEEIGQIGNWLCGTCQILVDHPDLKQRCKPCELVDVKPRDVFRALPDLDFWVIASDDVDQTHFEESIQAAVQAEGFQSSDVDVIHSIRDAVRVMQTLETGLMPRARLPIDLHIVTENSLNKLMRETPTAVKNGDFLGIVPRSWHKIWEMPDAPYDFVKDFIFSLTEGEIQNEGLRQLLKDTRTEVAQLLGDNAAEFVRLLAPKEARQLETPAIHDNLDRRVKSWL